MKKYGRVEKWENSKLVSIEYRFTYEEYLDFLKIELKEILKQRFENECPLFKQINADNGLLSETETHEVKQKRAGLLDEYETRKSLLAICQDNDDMELIVRSNALQLTELKDKYLK